MDAPGSKEAAVLVPLYTFDGELHAVFTERRDDMRKHAGEISFPGGRQDEPDEDLRQTALREAEEEIGLDPGVVEMVGALPPVGTFVTGYKVHPFVGLIPEGLSFKPSPSEVAAILLFRLDELRQRELQDLLDLALLQRPRLAGSDQAHERVDAVAGHERADRRQRAHQLDRVLGQPDLLACLA